jgi:hypothetical protein
MVPELVLSHGRDQPLTLERPASAKTGECQRDTDGLLINPEHNRALAGNVREMAQLARFAFAREELLRLATSFEYRARDLGRYRD